MLDLGDTVQLRAKVHDSSGNLANADTVTLTVTLPDGTAEPQTVDNPPAVTGTYVHPYVIVQAGRHAVRWTFTGTVPAQAHADVFDAREASPPFIISLESARRHLRIRNASQDDDEQLRGFIESATGVIERDPKFGVGPVVPRQVTERHYDCESPALFLYQYPVLEVTSVTSVFGDEEWLTADLLVDEDTGLVQRADGRPFRGGPWNVVYEAGRRVVSANITHAARIIIQHLWSTQRPRDVRRPPVATANELDNRQSQAMSAFSIPHKAVELLNADRQGPVIA